MQTNEMPLFKINLDNFPLKPDVHGHFFLIFTTHRLNNFKIMVHEKYEHVSCKYILNTNV